MPSTNQTPLPTPSTSQSTTPPHSGLTSSKTGTFYFAYGSNLSAHQMSLRLPHHKSSSIPVAICFLENYTWIICQRGYANVVELPPSSHFSSDNTVWGVLYNMCPEDEVMLDRYEGHDQSRNPRPRPNPDPQDRMRKPYLQDNWDYNKLYLPLKVTKWLRDPAEYGLVSSDQNHYQPKENSSEDLNSFSSQLPTTIQALVYVDEKRLEPGIINDEYIGRMNRGIEEACQLGLPEKWVEDVMRKYIPKGIFVDDQGYVGTVEGYVEKENGEVVEALATETTPRGKGLGDEVKESDLIKARKEAGNDQG